MSILFGLIFGALCWIAGMLKVPTRWLPTNPITAATRQIVAEFEQNLIADMKKKMMPTMPATSPTAPPSA